MSERLRVLVVPSRVDFGPYRSLERVEQSTRDAIAERFELVEIGSHPGREPEAYLEAFRAAQPIHAVLDNSDHAVHGPETPGVPSLFYALGGMPNGATFPWLRRARLKSTDVLLLNCASDLAIYRAALDGTGPVPELLPFGVDTSTFRPRSAAEDAATREALGVPAEAFFMLHAGRLNVQKNVHSVLFALRELAAGATRHEDREVHLVLAGGFDDIPHALFDVTNDGYEPMLRERIDRWGLHDRVHFAGKLGDEDLARAYSAADVFVTFTLHNNENFGYAPVEAMAAGTPVVGAHFGGLKDTVVHGETGFHVETLMTDNGLRAVWRQALGPLRELASSAELRQRMADAAVERARREYSLETYGERLGRIITDAIERCQAATAVPGTEFRFSKPAMQLHLNNLYRTYLRTAGRAKKPREAAEEYVGYRYFQGPYATHDTRDVELEDDDTLALLTRCRLDRNGDRLESLDPIWPATYHLQRAELDAIAAIEPGVTRAEVLARARELGLDEREFSDLLARLLAEGVVYRDRPFDASSR